MRLAHSRSAVNWAASSSSTSSQSLRRSESCVITGRGFQPSDIRDPAKKRFLTDLTHQLWHVTPNQQDGMPAAKPLDLEKIFTPAHDSGEITPRNRRMYASSSFYAPNHPTVEDQVELARRISHSLSDSSNRQSKGQSMYVSRKKRSVQWIHGDQAGTEESEETITNGSAAGPPPLKLVMDPRGQVQDLTSLRRQGINVETPLSPDLCFDLVRDLNSPTGKGAELFAKRRRKAEKWVVDESNVRVSVNEPQTPIVVPQTPGAAPPTAGTPLLVPSYLDPGRAQHQARLFEIQQRFTQPRLRMVKSPWDAALETGSVDAAFQELPKPRGFVMAPVPEAIDSWQEMAPAPSPLPPPPPVVTPASTSRTPASTSRTFTEPAPFSGIYGAKAPKGWPPAPGSSKVPAPVSGPIVKAALNTNPSQTKDTNITTAGSNIFEGSNCEAADFETICTQDTSALDESVSASFSQLEQIDINSTNSLTQSSTTTKKISTSEFSSTSASSAPAAIATAIVEEKMQTSSSELSHDIQTEAGVSYESQSFEKLMERFEMSGRPQLKYKQTTGNSSSGISTVIGTAIQSSKSAPVPEPKAAPVTTPAIPAQYYIAEASVQVRTFDQPLPISESVTMQQDMFSSSSLIEQKSSTRKEIVEEKKMFSSKQSLQQNFSSQQQTLSGSSLSQKSILQQQQYDASSLQEPLLLQPCILPQVSAEEPPPPPPSSSSMSYSPRTSISWTNYNTAPRGWSQNLHYYRPVTFNV